MQNTHQELLPPEPQSLDDIVELLRNAKTHTTPSGVLIAAHALPDGSVTLVVRNHLGHVEPAHVHDPIAWARVLDTIRECQCSEGLRAWITVDDVVDAAETLSTWYLDRFGATK